MLQEDIYDHKNSNTHYGHQNDAQTPEFQKYNPQPKQSETKVDSTKVTQSISNKENNAINSNKDNHMASVSSSQKTYDLNETSHQNQQQQQ